MPSQPPRFSFGKQKPPAKSWARPGKNAKRRLRGRAGCADRKRILADEPLCRICLAEGHTTASEEVDHIRDDVPAEEWDSRANKQGLCKPCHKKKTAEERAAGIRRRG